METPCLDKVVALAAVRPYVRESRYGRLERVTGYTKFQVGDRVIHASFGLGDKRGTVTRVRPGHRGVPALGTLVAPLGRVPDAYEILHDDGSTGVAREDRLRFESARRVWPGRAA